MGCTPTSRFVAKLEKQIMMSMGSYLSAPVEMVMGAGFDPLTWEWKGEGEAPDPTVYKNMLPRSDSDIFKSWLTQYLGVKSRDAMRLDEE